MYVESQKRWLSVGTVTLPEELSEGRLGDRWRNGYDEKDEDVPEEGPVAKKKKISLTLRNSEVFAWHSKYNR